MKKRLLFIMLLGAVIGADNQPTGDQPTDDLAAMQGTWNIVGMEMNGKSAGDIVRTAGLKVMIKGNTITYKRENGKDSQGTFALDAKQKSIDTTVDTTVEKGIYQLEGTDTLKLCIARSGKDRPREMKTAEGDGTMLFILKRESAKEKAKEP